MRIRDGNDVVAVDICGRRTFKAYVLMADINSRKAVEITTHRHGREVLVFIATMKLISYLFKFVCKSYLTF